MSDMRMHREPNLLWLYLANARAAQRAGEEEGGAHARRVRLLHLTYPIPVSSLMSLSLSNNDNEANPSRV